MGKWEPSPESVRARLGTMFTKLFVAWSIQQVAVPIVVRAVAFGHDRPGARGPDSAASVGLEVLLFAALVWVLGLVSALLVRRWLPRAAATGRWIWVLPTSVVFSGFIWELAHFGMATVLAEFSYPKEGEDAWLVVLLVLPAYSCIAYSIGMARRGWAGGCLRNDLP